MLCRCLINLKCSIYCIACPKNELELQMNQLQHHFNSSHTHTYSLTHTYIHTHSHTDSLSHSLFVICIAFLLQLWLLQNGASTCNKIQFVAYIFHRHRCHCFELPPSFDASRAPHSTLLLAIMQHGKCISICIIIQTYCHSQLETATGKLGNCTISCFFIIIVYYNIKFLPHADFASLRHVVSSWIIQGNL